MKASTLLRHINAHLKRTGEKAYPFGQRVLGDKAFVWKLRQGTRQPVPVTIKKIMAAIEASKVADAKAQKG